MNSAENSRNIIAENKLAKKTYVPHKEIGKKVENKLGKEIRKEIGKRNWEKK